MDFDVASYMDEFIHEQNLGVRYSEPEQSAAADSPAVVPNSSNKNQGVESINADTEV